MYWGFQQVTFPKYKNKKKTELLYTDQKLGGIQTSSEGQYRFANDACMQILIYFFQYSIHPIRYIGKILFKLSENEIELNEIIRLWLLKVTFFFSKNCCFMHKKMNYHSDSFIWRWKQQISVCGNIMLPSTLKCNYSFTSSAWYEVLIPFSICFESIPIISSLPTGINRINGTNRKIVTSQGIYVLWKGRNHKEECWNRNRAKHRIKRKRFNISLKIHLSNLAYQFTALKPLHI